MQPAQEQAQVREQYQTSANLEARMYLHNHFSLNKQPWQRWVFDQLRALLPENATVLEVGCGPAKLWLENRDRLPGGWQISLADFSEGMIEQARHNLGEPLNQFRFQLADAQQLPFGDAAFDGLVANHMIYHIPDKAKGLNEFRRVLKPGGWLLAATNGADHMKELGQLVTKFTGQPVLEDVGDVAPASFQLETGQQLLQSYFDRLELRIYEDGLAVTEAAPLVAYILSSLRAANWLNSLKSPAEKTAAIEKFREFIQAEIARDGAIRITKSTGLFIGQRL